MAENSHGSLYPESGIVDVFLFLGELFLLGMMFPELAAHNTEWGALKD
jgi:hypothetical protein